MPVPLGAVTTTSTVPAGFAGVTQVIDVALSTDTEVAAVPPNVTDVVPVKFAPDSLTVVPPAIVPLSKLSDVIVTSVYVYAAVFVPVPPGVVTATSTAPMAFAGVTHVTDVALTTVTDVAAVPPNVTVDAPVKFVPVSVTVVPPAVAPLIGLSDVMVGAAT